MTTLGKGALTLLGHTSVECGCCAVQIQESEAMYRHILVATDGSTASDKAVSEAIRLTQDQHAQLRAVHVVEDIPAMYFAYSDGVDLAALQASVRQAGQEALERAAAAAQHVGVAMETVLLPQDRAGVGDVILAAAKEWPADLIIMGTHGRHGLAHLLVGSVAEAVVRGATLPVLLLHAG
jgi:nucleotide-binding universal stress UspA family protein